MIHVKKNNLIISQDSINDVCSVFGLSRLTAELVLSRGFDLKQLDEFLGDGKSTVFPHSELPNAVAAAQRIENAMMCGEKIAVFGDYDADGICGTSIIINCLKNYGYDDVIYYIPNRISEGYGLNMEAVDFICEQACSLVITVDCGISNIQEVKYAKQKGIDVIITDHHIPSNELPNAIIVNPKLTENTDTENLCGAAVALKLMCVLFDDSVYYENCDLAAIATIADMVELAGENRHIVKAGLERINSKKNASIQALIDECVKNVTKIKADNIAYSVAPAINAAGRLDEADKCVELFTGGAIDPSETAAILAHDNYNRKKVEKDTFDSAEKKIASLDLKNNSAIILYDKKWHQGVLGIAASKLKNKYFRPVLLFTENEGMLVGSARSVDGLNIHEAIDYCSDYLDKFGGHFMAAGLSMEKTNFETFKEKMEEYLSYTDNELYQPKTYFDIAANVSEISLDILNEIEKLEPFGKGNPEPVILLEKVRIKNILRMGKDSEHYRAKIYCNEHTIPCVSFFSEYEPDENIFYDVLLSPKINEWNGNKNVQGIIVDIKPSTDKESFESIFQNMDKDFDVSLSMSLYHGDFENFEQSDFDRLKLALAKNSLSTLVLVVDAKSAFKTASELKDYLSVMDVRFIEVEDDKVNFNTLVIAPDFERLDLSGYDEIFIVSKYNISGLYKSLQPKGKVYIIMDNNPLDKSKFSLDIDRLRKLYLNIKKEILNNSITYSVFGRGEFAKWEVRAALKIFNEAKLLNYDINNRMFTLTEQKKTDITSSVTFNNFTAGV